MKAFPIVVTFLVASLASLLGCAETTQTPMPRRYDRIPLNPETSTSEVTSAQTIGGKGKGLGTPTATESFDRVRSSPAASPPPRPSSPPPRPPPSHPH